MSRVEDQLARIAEQKTDPRYHIIRMLGHGGMGDVWLARTLISGDEKHRTVVLKTIRPSSQRAENTEAARQLAQLHAFKHELFMREMRVTAGLTHANIAQLTGADVDLFGAEPFMELEFVPGLSVYELMAARYLKLHPEDAIAKEHKRDKARNRMWAPLTPLEVAWIGLGAAAGLRFAHRHTYTTERGQVHAGVIHRDISPDNILISNQGVIKILDWGIIKLLDQDGLSPHTTFKGKVQFAPPEQIRDGYVDGRSDIFALGVTLTTALAADYVFRGGETREGMLAAIIDNNRPPVEELVPNAPPALQELLHKMMEPDPANRPQSADELITQLEDLVLELGDGRFSTVQSAIAKDVEKYRPDGAPTIQAMDSQPSAIGQSETRRITPATDRGPGSALPSADAPPATQPLPSSEPTRVPSDAETSVAVAEPLTSRRPYLVAALAIGLLTLLGLVTGTLAFLLSPPETQQGPATSAGERTAHVEAPTEVQQVAAPAPPATPAPAETAEPAQNAPETPTAPEPDPQPPEGDRAAPERPQIRSPRRPRPPRVRPLAPQPRDNDPYNFPVNR